MSTLAAAVALVLGLARAETPPSAPGDWRGARWGMTVEEVLAAFPGEAARLEREEKLADGNIVAVGIPRELVEGQEFRVRFVFERGKLALVSLRTPPGKYADAAVFERIEKAMRERLGSPGTATRDAELIDLRQTRWTVGRTALDLKYIPGVVVLLYHPAEGPAAEPHRPRPEGG